MNPLLPAELACSAAVRRRLEDDHERLSEGEWPRPEDYVREAYGLDLGARLGRRRLRHPFGKASGQLSLNDKQVLADAQAGLAFAVLKTVIGESPGGAARMSAWKVEASRMECERIISRSGKEGWTISWIGRGWEGSLEDYADFLARAIPIGAAHGMPVFPSVKLHLPQAPGEEYERREYAHTLAVLLDAWRRGGEGLPLVVEKDFSPTLAGSDRARDREMVLRWLDEVPRLLRLEAPPGAVAPALKLMNALFEDDFQLEMLRRAAVVEPPLEFLTLFNRLFDPERRFGEHRGIAYGGHDLSDRNLEVLERWGILRGPAAEISATGNITSGRMMAEYALRGATSGQLHTYFQLPRDQYRSRGPRSRAALHELLFHPREGLIAAMDHLRRVAGRGDGELRFLELPDLGRRLLEARHG
jgi:hypothetical protein